MLFASGSTLQVFREAIPPITHLPASPHAQTEQQNKSAPKLAAWLRAAGDMSDAGKEEVEQVEVEAAEAGTDGRGDKTSLADVVAEVAAKLGRPAGDAEHVMQLLSRQWITTMDEYAACLDKKVVIAELPALMGLKLAERVAQLKDDPEDVGPTLDNIPADTAEDREQKAVIEELAKAFEAGEKHKVGCD